MVFDSLTHVTPDGRWFHTDLDASESHLLRQLDESRARRAMVVPLAGYIENSFVLEVCQRDASRLIPCASFNPAAHATPKDAGAALRAELRGSPYRALKLHPRLGRYDPLDPRCLAVLEEMASLGAAAAGVAVYAFLLPWRAVAESARRHHPRTSGTISFSYFRSDARWWKLDYAGRGSGSRLPERFSGHLAYNAEIPVQFDRGGFAVSL